MKKTSIFLILCLFLITDATSQIIVSAANNIGIDNSTPQSKLSIGANGSSLYKMYVYNSNASGSGAAYFLQQPVSSGYGFGSVSTIWVAAGDKQVGSYSCANAGSVTASRTFGLKAIAGNGYTGYNYGAHVYLTGTSVGTALLACIPGRNELPIPFMSAGYFRGTVYIEDSLGIKLTGKPSYPLQINGPAQATNWYTGSDSVLKKNIVSLSGEMLSKVKQLRGVTYQLKTPSELNLNQPNLLKPDTGKNDMPAVSYNTPQYTQNHIGFIAQEVRRVFPELVNTDQQGLLSLNYEGLIPVLLEAIKEQQATIESLKSDVQMLKNKIVSATGSSSQSSTTVQ